MSRITNEAYRMIEGDNSTGLNNEIDPLRYQNTLLQSYYRCLCSVQLHDIVLSRVSWVVIVDQEQSGVFPVDFEGRSIINHPRKYVVRNRQSDVHFGAI